MGWATGSGGVRYLKKKVVREKKTTGLFLIVFFLFKKKGFAPDVFPAAV